MRYFLLGDEHGNLEATDAVLDDMNCHYHPSFRKGNKAGEDMLVNIGDLVGYMPNPNEVMDRIYPLADINVLGNHDETAVNGKNLNQFNGYAHEAMLWTRNNLNELSRKRLAMLVNGKTYSARMRNLIFAHSTPFNPEAMRYVDGLNRPYGLPMINAIDCFFRHDESKGLTAFVGHIHHPQCYAYNGSSRLTDVVDMDVDFKGVDRRIVRIIDLQRYSSSLVVIPSVGQPRDGCFLAGYAVYDSNEKRVDFVRVPYDILKTQKKIEEAGLPIQLAERLAVGR